MSAYSRIAEMLSNAGEKDGRFPPTDLYNEGWMLRLCLDWFSTNKGSQSALRFLGESSWYSEALLPSAFLARSRGDSLAESWTHADGIIGDFDIGKKNVGGLTLRADARQLVVTEAKMFSKLSSGVTNARYYNQAARNVACIAEVLSRAEQSPDSLQRIGFFVVAPEVRIAEGVFDEQLRISNIRKIVERRIEEYDEPGKREGFEARFLPLLDVADIGAVSWETLLDDIRREDEAAFDYLGSFYEKCILYNEWVGRRYS